MLKKEDLLMRELLANPRDLPLFRSIDANRQGFMLLNLSRRDRVFILKKLRDQEIFAIIRYLDPDDTTDLLQNMNKRRSRNIVKKLDINIKDKVEYLLKFNPKTAAGLMSLDYIQVSKGMHFSEVHKQVTKHEVRTGKTPAILVVEFGYLVGTISWRRLVLCGRREKIDKYVRKAPTIRFDRDDEEVVKKFKNHPHNMIIVLDEDNSIIGVIYSDDVLRIIEKPSGDLYDFAGVLDEEDVHDSALSKVKHRYKWLILNLFTGFIAASVVSLFRDTISTFVLLAVYMPIVAGMGGTTGTQALAVVVRGLTLKEIELKTGGKAVLNEVIAGGLNGIIIGVLVATAAVFWNHSPMLGLALGLSMVINLMIAGFFGAIVPLIMKYLRNDPATSATIFITTATDICGFFVFLGLATMLM